jgi:hypothetical protein
MGAIRSENRARRPSNPAHRSARAAAQRGRYWNRFQTARRSSLPIIT